MLTVIILDVDIFFPSLTAMTFIIRELTLNLGVDKNRIRCSFHFFNSLEGWRRWQVDFWAVLPYVIFLCERRRPQVILKSNFLTTAVGVSQAANGQSLSVFFVCVSLTGWLSPDPLRQRALSKQTGSLQGVCYLAQNTGEKPIFLTTTPLHTHTHLCPSIILLLSLRFHPPYPQPYCSMWLYTCCLALPLSLPLAQLSLSQLLLSWQHNGKRTVWSTCCDKCLVVSVLLFPTKPIMYTFHL